MVSGVCIDVFFCVPCLGNHVDAIIETVGNHVVHFQNDAVVRVNFHDVKRRGVAMSRGEFVVLPAGHFVVAHCAGSECGVLPLPGGTRVVDRVMRMSGEVDNAGIAFEEFAQVVDAPAVGFAAAVNGIFNVIMLHEKDGLVGLVGAGGVKLLFQPRQRVRQIAVSASSFFAGQSNELEPVYFHPIVGGRLKDAFPQRAVAAPVVVVAHAQNPFRFRLEAFVHRLAKQPNLVFFAVVGHVPANQ